MKKIALFLPILVFLSCKNLEQSSGLDISNSAVAGNYISAFTPNNISVGQDITIRFSSAINQKVIPGQTLETDKLVYLKPSVKTKVYWKDVQTLVVDPEENLEFDTKYDLFINLDQVYNNIDDSLRLVKIPYQTQSLSLSIQFDGIDYNDFKGEDNILVLNGRVRSSDIIDPKELHDVLRARQKNNDEISVQWLESGNNVFPFQIYNIKRFDSPSTLEIEWEYSKDPTFKSKREMQVQAKGIFDLRSFETNTSERLIRLKFSERLNKDQDLNGLISIKDYHGTYRFDPLGNQLDIYPEAQLSGSFVLQLDKSILSQLGNTLQTDKEIMMSFEEVLPELRLSGNGVITPFAESVIFPFEAINLHSVKVEIFKIYQNNVLQFLQYNDLNGIYGLHPVGRIIHQEEIDLTKLTHESNASGFVRYALDLKHFIEMDAGAIYQVRIGFDQSDVIQLDCGDVEDFYEMRLNSDERLSILNQNHYSWREQDNPCHKAFYNRNRFLSRNVLATNIGMIAKVDKYHKVRIIASDLRTLEPLAKLKVRLFDFQQQQIGEGLTDQDGMAMIEAERKPAFATVYRKGEHGYINLQDQRANSLSEFDVSGKSKKKGLDGFIYGERGVWRPGDTLYLSFVLEDKDGKIPVEHPVSFEVFDSRGVRKFQEISTRHLGHVYSFKVPTSDADPTGNWKAMATIGGAYFQKFLKVETIKPNRLKVNLEVLGESISLHQNGVISLESRWLHGALADGLKADVDLQLKAVSTRFTGYAKYHFDDPARKVDPVPIRIFDGQLDNEGKATIEVEAKPEWLAPGKLNAALKARVYERGGNFSERNVKYPADLYESYVGISIPTNRWGSKFITEGQKEEIPIVVLDSEGKPMKDRKLYVGIYNAEWNWWYDRAHNNRYTYNSGQHNGAVSREYLTTNAQGEAMYTAEFNGWGNYMIRVCDTESGHCTGDFFYTGRNWSSGVSAREGPHQLILTTDKSSYYKGEEMEIRIPSNKGSRLLLSIENGEKVLQTFWVDAKDNETLIKVPAEAGDDANIYIHAHLVQAHNNGENDLPLRMYGVISVKVIDKSSELAVKLKMPDELRPNEAFELSISEENGRPMTYTIAVVDEGLLDLTNFKTPDLWAHFYAKQALGVKTWDIYDLILNAYGGEIDRYISIGGDNEVVEVKTPDKVNRFKPVVRFIGPFQIKSGAHSTHKISLPNYVGSVRTMVVARHENAYGKADKTTAVKKPLMLLSTLPRVISPNEKLELPVNVFAMDDKIRKVDLSIETSDNIKLTATRQKQLQFEKQGDKQAYFELEIGDVTGPAFVQLTGKSRGELAVEKLEFNIRNPNPIISEVLEKTLEPGETWKVDYETFGMPGTNKGFVELSQVPPINFNGRLNYLIRYPYGCIEQTTSSVFPQLYLANLLDLNSKQKIQTELNIKSGIERLSLFQLYSGGFSYWPGNSEVSEWGTNYAGHFLVEAKAKGYYVSEDLIRKYLRYQTNLADNYLAKQNPTRESRWLIKSQAYRLYVLALAGKPNISAMNRFRNYDHRNITSSFMLAAAYAIIGKKEIAKELISNKNIHVEPYIETGQSYGSHIRDLAMISEALSKLGDQTESADIIKQIAENMNSGQWYSTQTTAFALLAIGKIMKGYEGSQLAFEMKKNGYAVDRIMEKPLFIEKIEMEKHHSGQIEITNTSESVLFIKFVQSGQPPPGEDLPAVEKYVSMSVNYTDREGRKIDPSSLQQGTDFMANVSIRNISNRYYEINELALSQIFPAGWEIHNTRFTGFGTTQKNSAFEYQDIRDDAVYTFFDIKGKDLVNFTVPLTATYSGRFYLPPVTVEAMYDNEIQARISGGWVEVIK